jgi:glycine cleavage system H protein
VTNPASFKYTPEHEWLEINDGVATVGITAYAADALGDVVFVELPTVGTLVTGGTPCGEIESTKSVSDLFAPADGEVLEINDAVAADPAAVNADPFRAGWLFRMRIVGTPELLDAEQYDQLTGGE